MKTVLYLAMSVNGMIAGENDEAPWSKTEWDLFRSAVEATGNLIIGRRTYEIMKKGNEFSSFMFNPLCIVVSQEPINDDIALVVKSLPDAILTVKERGLNTALVAGGSKLATAFLEANLIDEIQLDVEPILMGQGIPFLHNSSIQAKLSLVSVKQLNESLIHLTYTVEKEAK